MERLRRTEDDGEPRQRRKFWKILPWWVWIIVLAVVLIITFLTISASVKIVDTGYKGVLTEFGRIKGTLDPGLHFIAPFTQQVESLSTQVQKAESTESAASADLQDVSTTIAVNYKLDENYVDVIWSTLRREYETRVIQPNIEESIKAVTAKHKAEDLVGQREDVKREFQEILTSRLEQYHIQVLSVSVTNFQFSAGFTAAIEAKVNAEQRALEEKNKLEQIRYEAQQKIIQAEADANATITRTTAEATALIIQSTAQANSTLIMKSAEAEGMRLIAERLSQQYLFYQQLQRWNGQLPWFWSSNSTSPFIFQLPQQGN